MIITFGQDSTSRRLTAGTKPLPGLLLLCVRVSDMADLRDGNRIRRQVTLPHLCNYITARTRFTSARLLINHRGLTCNRLKILFIGFYGYRTVAAPWPRCSLMANASYGTCV